MQSSSGSEKSWFEKKIKERRKLVICEQMRLGQTEVEWKHQIPILSAGPLLKASQLSLQPLIPTVLEKLYHLKLEQEKGKGQEMVLIRNVPELKQDLCHIEAEQGKGEHFCSGITG